MKHEADFRSYLSDVRVSSKTGKAYSPKVVTDILRRCRMVEAFLCVELSTANLGTHKDRELLCDKIRLDRLGATPTVPYAHLSLINAVRIYADFLMWRCAM